MDIWPLIDVGWSTKHDPILIQFSKTLPSRTSSLIFEQLGDVPHNDPSTMQQGGLEPVHLC